jgi:hypothetical protein
MEIVGPILDTVVISRDAEGTMCEESGVIPRSEIAGTKPPYVRAGYFIHTYSNNMINRFHVQ